MANFGKPKLIDPCRSVVWLLEFDFWYIVSMRAFSFSNPILDYQASKTQIILIIHLYNLPL